MRIDRGSSGLWGKQSRLRDTNMLQDVRRQNVKRWRTRPLVKEPFFCES